MFTFGKKLSFRPLLISLLLTLTIGTICAEIFGSWGWLGGAIVFAIMIGLHYPNVLELEFNYFEITDQQIKYYDFSSWWRRVLMIFSGPKTTLKSIDLTQVVAARTLGEKEGQQMPVGLPYSNPLATYTGLIATVKNLYWIEIELKNGQKKYFSLARDKAYETEKTISKAKLAVRWILASNGTTKKAH